MSEECELPKEEAKSTELREALFELFPQFACTLKSKIKLFDNVYYSNEMGVVNYPKFAADGHAVSGRKIRLRLRSTPLPLRSLPSRQSW